MPISRKKACVQCRVAKARCNLTVPCSRCFERGLECTYRDTDFRHGHFPLQSDASEPFGGESAAPRNAAGAPGPPEQSNLLVEEIRDLGAQCYPLPGQAQDLEFIQNHRSQTIGQILDLDSVIFPDLGRADCLFSDLPSDLPDTFSSDPIPRSIDRVQTQHSPTSTYAHAAERPGSSWTHAPGTRVTDEAQYSTYAQANSVPEVEKGLTVIYGKLFCDVLLPKNSTTIQSSLMAQVLWGQVRAYPEMMIHGQLPPFIYPSCVLDGRLPKDCIVNGVHRCLSGPLAICTSLVRMFYGRTPANSAYVWDAIHSEQSKLKHEYQSYDDHALLSTLQSVTIYGLLQAQDLHSVQRNDLELLANLGKDVAQQLWKFMPSNGDIYKKPDLTHREWAFYESIVRTVNLLYMEGSLINAVMGRKSIFCSGSNRAPLAGPKLLWDYGTSESWARRFDRFKEMGLPEYVPTISDLTMFVHKQTDWEANGNLAMDMAKWCEGIDEFGTLIWMTTSLSG